MRGFVKLLAFALAALWASTTAGAQSADATDIAAAPDKIERFGESDDADELSLTPAKFLLFCTECDDERKALRAEVDALEAELGETERRLNTLEGSFGKVRVDWVKVALFYGGYYNKDAARLNKVNSKVYDQLAIEAVKRFQCKFHPEVAGKCDPTLATGWITYPEARHAICKQGFNGTDETAIRLADWYAFGEVYEKNPLFAFALIKKYLANLEKQLSAPGADEEKLHALRSDAQDLYGKIGAELNKRGGRRGKVYKTPEEACPKYDPALAVEHAH